MDANTSQQFGVFQKQLLNHMQQSHQVQHKSEMNAIIQRLNEIDRRLGKLEEKAEAEAK